jgi:hypothetical protein
MFVKSILCTCIVRALLAQTNEDQNMNSSINTKMTKAIGCRYHAGSSSYQYFKYDKQSHGGRHSVRICCCGKLSRERTPASRRKDSSFLDNATNGRSSPSGGVNGSHVLAHSVIELSSISLVRVVGVAPLVNLARCSRSILRLGL